jgi:hypothetical protein
MSRHDGYIEESEVVPRLATCLRFPRGPDLLHVHEIVLKEARARARVAAEAGDNGTNDVIVNDVARRNELQVWFVAGHPVDTPLVQAVSRGCVAAR